MSGIWLAVFGVYALSALWSAGSVLRRRKEPSAMVAWLLAIVTLPGLGALLYWLLGSDRLRRKVGRRRRRVAGLLARYRERAEQQSHTHEARLDLHLPPDQLAIAHLAQRLAHLPAAPGNEVLVLEESNATYAALEDALHAAQRHIHLEYYIWQPDETGRHFRDLVVERARAGVECRLLLDAGGCWRLGRAFLRPLLAAGVQVAFFLPLWVFPLRKRYSWHLRNHRKIAVIDGQVAFLGSQNIGDEYRGRLRRLSPWYDTHMRIQGPAALFVQQTFAEDWHHATRKRLDSAAYFPEPQHLGDSVVQVLPTGPDQRGSTLAQILFAAVSSAQTSIRIATPYFGPDIGVRMALAHACYRGVRVSLLLPTRSDSPLSLWAARSFYNELLAAGVEVFEYDAGVLHSKIVTVDDRWCMVGSANMDVRSFRLNFEITALIYDPAVATALGRSIDEFSSHARHVHSRDLQQHGRLRQIGEGAARLFAPLL